jgi:hypothetical protein
MCEGINNQSILHAKRPSSALSERNGHSHFGSAKAKHTSKTSESNFLTMAVKTTPNSLDDDVVQHADVLNGSANDMEDPTCQETARMISLESIQVPALGETPYFDVETEQVKNKMLHALFGSHTKNSFWSTSSDESGIQDSDIDLMGPLWITLMVAFLFGVRQDEWLSTVARTISWYHSN